MKSYEAMQLAISRRTEDVAKRLGVSTSLIHKWQEPSTDYSDSGAYNPLDRIEEIILHSLQEGNPPERAYAPIHYLAHQFSFAVLPIPDPNKGDCGDVTHELMDTIAEFGDLTRETAKAMQDGRISASDSAKIEKEAWELIQQVSVFIRKVKDSVR